MNKVIAKLAVIALLSLCHIVSADVFNLGEGFTNLETVSVGDAGNIGELSGAGAGGFGPDRMCGVVGYAYNIGKYEVTAKQYTAFLNAVAATDTYGLYHTEMFDRWSGCRIQRSGSSGSYTYSVVNDRANRPVNYVSYWDSCRFANWLHNGQPTGSQDSSTTERGAYALDSYNGDDGQSIARDPGAKWAVTSEDEWYKAAYYKGGGSSTGYWDYPTSSDVAPANQVFSPDPGNSANYCIPWTYTLSYPYTTTNAGEFENSASPYGTFDQSGNLWEWNEALVSGATRGLRGGSFDLTVASYQQGSFRNYTAPTYEAWSVGFRVTNVGLVSNPGLRGTVVLQDLIIERVLASNVTIEITQGTTTTTEEVTLAADGGFTLITSMTGPATVRAKASHWLAQQQNVSDIADAVVSFSLINGDCDGDNEITSTDLSILGLALGSVPGDGNWDGTADLDGDGEITSTDLSILGLGLGIVGD